jgi:hypothetical protein
MLGTGQKITFSGGRRRCIDDRGRGVEICAVKVKLNINV